MSSASTCARSRCWPSAASSSPPSRSAAAAHWLLGLAWPVGFVLGAIVSPPDAVAPLSIARGMQLPRRILVVLEGEGLANDATALILYRFAAPP